MNDLSTPRPFLSIPSSGQLRRAAAFVCAAVVISAGLSANAQVNSEQFTTRTLNIVNLKNPTQEIRISPNLLTRISFPDEVIEEIKSAAPELFTIEIDEAGNEISLKAAAKAGYTDLHVKTTSGMTAAFLLKIVPDAQGGPRNIVVNSPSLIAAPSPSTIPSVPSSLSQSAPSIPAMTSVIQAPANATRTPTAAPAPTPRTVPPARATATAPAPKVVQLTNPMVVAAKSNEPIDYRTQAIVDNSGKLVVYYELRNISDETITIDPKQLSVKNETRNIEYQLTRKAALNSVNLKPGESEIGAILIENAANLGSIELSWIVSNGATSYTYARSYDAKQMQQP